MIRSDKLKKRRNRNTALSTVGAGIALFVLTAAVVLCALGVAGLKTAKAEAVGELTAKYDVEQNYTPENYEKIQALLSEAELAIRGCLSNNAVRAAYEEADLRMGIIETTAVKTLFCV
ncbi:MAG: hypothetical protein LBQ40_03300 [Clostridiales bacterium]|jgi:hypothetical protein|nr:hypothetical protein [Clostridiales bacterium]